MKIGDENIMYIVIIGKLNDKDLYQLIFIFWLVGEFWPSGNGMLFCALHLGAHTKHRFPSKATKINLEFLSEV